MASVRCFDNSDVIATQRWRRRLRTRFGYLFFFWTKVGQVILKASTAVASGSRCHETAELSDLALRPDAIKSRLHERRSGLP